MTLRRAAATTMGVALLTQAAPALFSLGPLCRALAPRLAGRGVAPHVALTFDDGPDPRSTPFFLDLLAEHQVRATFFLLGAHVAPNRGLVAEMAERGHELAVHGWTHRCTAVVPPSRLVGQLRDAADAIEQAGGRPVRWYRPPYGVLTTETLWAARAAGLETVLWTAWGRDWERRATPTSVVRTLDRTLVPGGTVLLHDTDRTSSPDSWRTTLSATRMLLEHWAEDGTVVGPLAEHYHHSGVATAAYDGHSPTGRRSGARQAPALRVLS